MLQVFQFAVSSVWKFLSFFFINYLFLAVLGLLRCCAWAFSSCGEWGLLFIVVCGLLIAVASLVVKHRLQVRGLQQLAARKLRSCGSRALERRLSSCGTRAQLLRGMWYLPGPGLKPVFPALAGRFLTTVPLGKPPVWKFLDIADSSLYLSPPWMVSPDHFPPLFFVTKHAFYLTRSIVFKPHVISLISSLPPISPTVHSLHEGKSYSCPIHH